MVKGLEQELQARLDGKKINAMSGNYPSPAAIDAEFLRSANRKIQSANANVPDSTDGTVMEVDQNKIKQQGADISIPIRRVWKWVSNRRAANR